MANDDIHTNLPVLLSISTPHLKYVSLCKVIYVAPTRSSALFFSKFFVYKSRFVVLSYISPLTFEVSIRKSTIASFFPEIFLAHV